MKEKMMMIMTTDEIARISENLDGTIMVDLHGLSVASAKRLLTNVMSLDREGHDICAIHGYNHGTAIKEMILYRLSAPRLTAKVGVVGNYGRTILKMQCVA